MSFFRKDLVGKKPVVVDVPHKKVMMCLNESSLDPYQAVKSEFLELMENIHLNRYYSWITATLKKELAAYVEVTQDMIIMGNGADELLYYLFLAVNDPQAFALTLSPSYFDYLSYCQAVGLPLKMLPLEKDFSFSTARFLEMAADSACKLLILCNPNNPTGNLFPQEQLEEIIAADKERLVLIDETYFEFSGVSWLPKLARYPNLIILRTFSKAFSAAGLRFGYLVAGTKVISEIRKVVTAFNLSILSQTMALAILHNKAIFLQHNQSIVTERERLANELRKFPEITVFPSSTNFILFRYQKSVDLFTYLIACDIALRDVGSFEVLENCLRVTVGNMKENDMFISRIMRFMK
ncbi:MAG: histidinol-phosphate transaminase [Candidatus Cloacimonetes bacterium]|nr:histidinol-phosphate transaminase [Candidatus Cloacimonadota bacterium]